MKHWRLLTLPLLLYACAQNGATHPSTGPDPDTPTGQLTQLWALPMVQTLGYTQLLGELLLAGQKVRGVNVRTHNLQIHSDLQVDIGRTNFAALGQDIVLLSLQDSSLNVIDRQGKLLSRVPLPQPAATGGGQKGPFVAGEALYVAVGSVLYKYRAADMYRASAQPLWHKTFSGPQIAALQVADAEHLYVSSWSDSESRVYALGGGGQTLWQQDVVLPGWARGGANVMALSGQQLVVQASSAGLQSFDTQTGKRTWKAPVQIDVCPSGPSPYAQEMTIGGGRVYLGHSGGSCVLAFSLATGALDWVFDAPNQSTFDTQPLYLNGVVYATNGRLWALDAATGKQLAVAQEDQGANSGTPLSYDPVGRQLISWGQKGLYAYRPLR